MTTRVAAVVTSLIMRASELGAPAPGGQEWLAEEEAALRRVATLVASSTPRDVLLRATVDEVREQAGVIGAALMVVERLLAPEAEIDDDAVRVPSLIAS